MRLYLDAGVGSIFSRDADGLTPFLRTCENFGAGCSKEVLSLLLDRGANVLDLDSKGRNCLHLLFLRLHGGRDTVNPQQEVDAVAFLVSRGADVRATDCTGRSVSHVVYSRTDWDIYLGSFRRDLWDFALATNNHDVRKVRGNIRRVGWYTPGKRRSHYTRARFRQLWAGHKGLCPYPEDLEDAGADESQDEAMEDEDGDREDVNYSHGDSDAGQAKANAEDSDPEDSDPEDSDPEDFGPEDSDSEGPEDLNPMDLDSEDFDAEDPSAEDSEFDSSSSDGSLEEYRCARCNTPRMTNNPQCHGCGWSFGCQDPDCRYFFCLEYRDMIRKPRPTQGERGNARRTYR